MILQNCSCVVLWRSMEQCPSLMPHQSSFPVPKSHSFNFALFENSFDFLCFRQSLKMTFFMIQTLLKPMQLRYTVQSNCTRPHLFFNQTFRFICNNIGTLLSVLTRKHTKMGVRESQEAHLQPVGGGAAPPCGAPPRTLPAGAPAGGGQPGKIGGNGWSPLGDTGQAHRLFCCRSAANNL